jgi:hypothetical protein
MIHVDTSAALATGHADTRGCAHVKARLCSFCQLGAVGRRAVLKAARRWLVRPIALLPSHPQVRPIRQPFASLQRRGNFDPCGYFGVRFLVQFGCSLDEDVAAAWAERPAIPDDPSSGHPTASRSFSRGMMAFAGTGPHSRTDQLFIAFEDSEHLGQVRALAFSNRAR